MILNAVAIIGDRNRARLRKLTDRREFFAGNILRDRASRQDVHAGNFRRAIS